MEGTSRDGSEMFDSLPEDCISRIFLLTSPRDMCCFATSSRRCQSLADSDSVWAQFLPSNYQDILSRAVTPVHFSSKKDLFFRLCVPILVDDEKHSFVVDKSSGKLNFMFSARSLEKIHMRPPFDVFPDYLALPESRFPDVYQLKVCTGFEHFIGLNAELTSVELSQKTTYVVYLVYKLNYADLSYFLSSIPTTDVYHEKHEELLYKQPFRASFHSDSCLISKEELHSKLPHDVVLPTVDYFANQREGSGGEWMEVALGEIFNDGADGKEKIVVDFSWLDCGGLDSIIIQGIEFRVKI